MGKADYALFKNKNHLTQGNQTMALDERFIPITSLNQYFVDKDSGLPLANGTLEFFRDTARITPKAVFQLTGAPPLDSKYDKANEVCPTFSFRAKNIPLKEIS